FGPARLGRERGLAGVDAVPAGDHVVVVAFVEEMAPAAAGGRRLEAAVGALFADELDLVGEVVSEEGVLTGGGGRDPHVADVAPPLERLVQPVDREADPLVALLEVVPLVG